MTSVKPIPALVLASSSPYRQQLLSRLGVTFTVCSPDIDESAQAGEPPEQLAQRLAHAKAEHAARRHSNAVVIGSDQIAIYEGQVLGKPLSHQVALEQLCQSSGKSLIFLTSICVLGPSSNDCQVATVPCTVTFRSLPKESLENYLRIEQPYDCAGSFKSEGLGIALLERMETEDPTTLIGLPLIKLSQMLSQAGIPII